jgi:uncharacterized membrane protein
MGINEVTKRFKNALKSKKIWYVLTVFILIVSVFLRFYNLNWDHYLLFHPDERNIANAVTKIHFFNQLNPEFFAYGGLTIYLYRFWGDVIDFLTKNQVWVTDWGHINLIGRICSAIFSSFTVIAIYFLAKIFFNKKVAFLSFLIAAFTVSFIQSAHFAVTESIITLVVVLTCLLSKKIFEKPKTTYALLIGITTGLGIAAKITAVSFLIIPVFALLLLFIKQKSIRKFILNLTLISITTFATFFVFSPYTLLNWNKFWESMKYESGVATGSYPVVYTLQFNHSISYLFQLENLFWQIGPIALFAILGFIFLVIFSFLKKQKELVIFYIFPLLYFLYVGSWHTKFIRYMIPILPFLIIAASFLLFEITKKFKKTGFILISTFLLLTAFWAMAFFSIYTKEQTRISASEWVYLNVPVDKTILTEQWDDTLPVPIGTLNLNRYKDLNLTMYEPDNSSKINYLTNNLSKGDYIIFNSRRLYGTLINLTKEYPITSNYYKLLFEGKLGYKQVAEFTSYPSIFGFEIKDDVSEETFQVYDHPKVIIFKNTKHFSINDYLKIL